MELKFIQTIHKGTRRNYLSRMIHDKVDCAKVARRFGKEFWDGDRKYGYGGYTDDGRWKKVAQKIIERYKLNHHSKVLDIGCGKGYLANEIQRACYAEVWGCDISRYALDRSPLLRIFKFKAGEDVLFNEFDLIISINALHNLLIPELKQAIEQINTHSKQAYIVVESYRSVQELHNLECWNLTGEQFLRPEEWEFLFNEWGYGGDYEFIFFD